MLTELKIFNIVYLNNICQKSVQPASTSLIVATSSSKCAKEQNSFNKAQEDRYVIEDDASLEEFDTVAFVTEENDESGSCCKK